MDRPGINTGTGSPALRCVFVEWVRTGQNAVSDWNEEMCGLPGVGMFEQKPYCEEHIEGVAQRARQNDQASPTD